MGVKQEENNHSMSPDRYDRKILEILQANARISNLDLAEAIGLSPSPCSRRVRHLEESGIIARYVTLLNPKKLDLKLTAFIHISMDRHVPERFERFEAKVSSYPEVLECYLITGQSADYLLKVVVPDMEAYHDFLMGKITCLEGVSGVHSSFALRRPVEKTELPLGRATFD